MEKKTYETPEVEYVELENSNVILDSTITKEGGKNVGGEDDFDF